MKRLLKLALIWGLLISCGKEEFAKKVQSESVSVSAAHTTAVTTCAQHTLIKPKVDFLIMIDNSTSTNHLKNGSIQAFIDFLKDRNRIPLEDYDFHITVAPLLRPTGESLPDCNYKVALEGSDVNVSPCGIGANPDRVVGADTIFSLPGAVQGNLEDGLRRVHWLLDADKPSTTNVFRENAHHIIILFSNGDDTRWLVDGPPGFPDYGLRQTYFQQALANIRALRDGVLRSQQLRFLSVVAHNNTSSCQGGAYSAIKGENYIDLSRELYKDTGLTDQCALPTCMPDSINLCDNSYAGAFDQIAATILKEIVGHKYDYWPVTNSSCLSSSSQITEVRKYPSGVSLGENTADGWQLRLNQVNRNMRYEPIVTSTAPAETYTGHMLQLYGGARLTYPECLTVRTVDPFEQFRYAVIAKAPDVGSVVIRKNGATLSQSSSNGWTYVGYRENQNIKVNVPVPGCSATLPSLKTGYFFEFHGSARYQSGDHIEISFRAAAI